MRGLFGRQGVCEYPSASSKGVAKGPARAKLSKLSNLNQNPKLSTRRNQSKTNYKRSEVTIVGKGGKVGVRDALQRMR